MNDVFSLVDGSQLPLQAHYDGETDVLYLARAGIEDNVIEVAPGVRLELDEQRQIIGIEILRASEILGAVAEPLRARASA